MNLRWSCVLALLCATALAAGCGARRYKSGVLDVSVANRGERPVYDVMVQYGTESLPGPAMNAGEVVRSRFLMQPKVPLRIQYTDVNNRRIDKTYEVHARPEDGGEIQFRIDRDGNVQPVGRFDVYHKK